MCVCTADGKMFELQTALLSISVYLEKKYLVVSLRWLEFIKVICHRNLGKLPLGGGRLGSNYARMCVSKNEGHGPFFGFKEVK